MYVAWAYVCSVRNSMPEDDFDLHGAWASPVEGAAGVSSMVMPPSKSSTLLGVADLAAAAAWGGLVGDGAAAAAAAAGAAVGGGAKLPSDSCTVGFTSDSFFGCRGVLSTGAAAGAAGFGAGFTAATAHQKLSRYYEGSGKARAQVLQGKSEGCHRGSPITAGMAFALRGL